MNRICNRHAKPVGPLLQECPVSRLHVTWTTVPRLTFRLKATRQARRAASFGKAIPLLQFQAGRVSNALSQTLERGNYFQYDQGEVWRAPKK